jgi:hypothetical protein
MSNHVEGVRGCSKSLLSRQFVHHGAHGAFEVWGRGYVHDAPARRAKQVMMVMGEIFGQLETGKLIIGGDSTNDAGGLQI